MSPALQAHEDAVPVSRYFLFFILASVGCATDLLSKHWVFQWRGLPRADNIWWIWPEYVGIEPALNTGALFGLGKGQVVLFAGLSIVAAIGIVCWLFWAKAATDRLLTIALGCVLGGILGNLYDRLGLWGGQLADGTPLLAVRDWILLRYQGHTWPNFNIADALLVCGAGLLFLHAFLFSKPAAASEN